MTSGSFTLPPGCAMAVTPCAMAASTPSGNGKNASDASTLPLRLVAGLLASDLHADDARHLPRAHADRPRSLGQHDGVRLHVLRHRPGELERLELGLGRARAWSPPCRAHLARAGRVARLHDEAAAHALVLQRADRRGEPGTRREQAAGSSWRAARSSARRENEGATMHSRNVSASTCAVATSTSRFSATMPPKADTGSASRAVR